MKENLQSKAISTSTGCDIPEKELRILQQIARDQLIEPFTGHRSLETIQKTRSEMEKGLVKIKDASSKAGRWLSKSRVASHSQQKLSDFIQDLKDKPSSERVSGFLERMNQATEEIQKLAKKSYSGIEDKSKRLTLTMIEKGLELMLYEDSSNWIIEKAEKCLDRVDIKNLEQIRQLSREEREKLLDELYPYDSQLFKKYMKGVETSVNIGLGAVVATNIPGTGIAVSLVNMGKTLVKVGNRLGLMSAIYGRQMSGKAALFKISATIIRSLEDWESNDQHVPLNPDILDELYQPSEDQDEDGFQDLLNSVMRKDAYIAVPGVGMISLGKINLDDLKIEMLVRHLVQNYAEKARLIERYGNEQVADVLTGFNEIYRIFLASDFFRKFRKKTPSTESKTDKPGWRSRLKLLAGEDADLEQLSQNLDDEVLKIYQATRLLEEPDREQEIAKMVEALLGKASSGIKARLPKLPEY